MVVLTGAAQAALVSLGDGTVRDTNTNQIWLQDWDVNGGKTWATQKNWAENLSFAGSNEWRLPEIGEYAKLFEDYLDLTQVAEFENVQPAFYWSGTEFTSGTSAWVFFPVDGFLTNGDFQANQFFAVAVRPGDVAASVPEPQTLALALLALGATVVARRRRTA